MPENQHLSLEKVQQIVRETRAKRALSQPEITRLAYRLNLYLGLHKSGKRTSSEPTFLQLGAQIEKLRTALKVLKKALPPAEQVSLRNYLVHLGEAYAETRGPHPNLPAVNHYRSDERLDEMISSVSQVLEWIDKTPADMEKPRNWWELTPSRDFNMPLDAHRRGGRTEALIGGRLPRVYEKTFQTKYGLSRPGGPGVCDLSWQYSGRPEFLTTLIGRFPARPSLNIDKIIYAIGAGTSSQPFVLGGVKKISRSSNDG